MGGPTNQQQPVGPHARTPEQRSGAGQEEGVPAHAPRQEPTRRSVGWRRLTGWGVYAGTASAALGCLLLVATAATPLSVRWYNVQSGGLAIRHAPAWYPVAPLASFGGAEPRAKESWLVRAAHATTSWLGHDDLGRSLLFRVLPGVLLSTAMGLSAACIAVIIGVGWGALAALLGGWVDRLMMRIVDVLYSLPYVLTVILLKIALTPPLRTIFGERARLVDMVIVIAAVGGVSWLTMARVVRGQVLSLRQRPFVEAARAAGAGPIRILRVHLLPNLARPILAYGLLIVPQAVMQEAFLSFLGIGIHPPTPSLGRLAAEGVQAVNSFVSYWWLLVYPCGALVILLASLNVIGDSLQARWGRSATHG